jgi:hypothetical protein
MYRALNGNDIRELETDSEIPAWRKREGDFFNLVDRVTRRLTRQRRILPMRHDRDPHDYRRLYSGKIRLS